MKKTLKELLNKKTVILDGATGTNLQKRGLPGGVCPEQWVLEHKEVMIELQKAYVEAGSDVLYAPTFSGNRIKLKEYGLQDSVSEMNKALVAVCKEAAGDQVLVAGDMTMTGQQLMPLGTLSFDELLACYKEQAKALDEAGVDLFVVETMMSLQETRAAVLAIREVSVKPLMVTMTFETNGRTLYGTDPVTALVTLQEMGIDAFGINCSAGPDTLLPHIRAMKRYAKVPLVAKANAGLPMLVDGETVFPMQPDEFAAATEKLIENGASIVGGCCGTGPAHIKALSQTAAALPKNVVSDVPEVTWQAVTTERKTYDFENGFDHLEIGTHITASKCPELIEDFKEGMFDTLYDLLDEEACEEPDIICVDIDAEDEDYDPCEIVGELISELSSAAAPIAFSTLDMKLLDKYLKLYPGRALVKYKEGSNIKNVEALAVKYGAVVI